MQSAGRYTVHHIAFSSMTGDRAYKDKRHTKMRINNTHKKVIHHRSRGSRCCTTKTVQCLTPTTPRAGTGTMPYISADSKFETAVRRRLVLGERKLLLIGHRLSHTLIVLLNMEESRWLVLLEKPMMQQTSTASTLAKLSDTAYKTSDITKGAMQ